MLNHREGAPFSGLPIDLVFLNICRHLTPVDLGRAMRVSRGWLLTLITDPAWSHVKARVLSQCPEWESQVYAEYPWKTSGEAEAGERDAKKAKLKKGKVKLLIMPVGGTWYVTRRFIAPLQTMAGIKSLCIPRHVVRKNDDMWMEKKRFRVAHALFMPFFRLWLAPDVRANIESTSTFPHTDYYWVVCIFFIRGKPFINIRLPIGVANTVFVSYRNEISSQFTDCMKALLNGIQDL